MKRTIYKNHVIDYDELGRVYVYNRCSKYAEDSDKAYVTDFYGTSRKRLTDLQAAKLLIDNK